MRVILFVGLLCTVPGCDLWGGGGGGAGGSTSPLLYFADCGDSCSDADWNLAAGGAHTTITTNVAYATVVSTNPDVATFVGNGPSIEAFSGMPGTTELDLLDENGHVLASHAVPVVATASLIVPNDSLPNPPLVLEGAPQLFHVVTKDPNGNSTRGDGSVHFALTGTLTDAVLPIDGDEVGFVGTPGSGLITATCPNAALAEPVTVVSLAQVTGLMVGDEQNAPTASIIADASGVASTFITAQSTLGDLYAGPCAWTVSDPSVALVQQLASTLDLGPGTFSQFVLTRPGQYTATCALAGLTTTLMLTSIAP